MFKLALNVILFYCRNMSMLIKRQFHLLKFIASLPKKQQAEVLALAPKELVRAYSEGALNILKGNVKLSDKQFKSLKRQGVKLKTLANRKSSNKKKKNVIQTGGFLGILSSILIPAIAGLISGAAR